VQYVLARIDTNGNDCGVKLARHGVAPSPDCPQACSLVGREHGRSIPFSPLIQGRPGSSMPSWFVRVMSEPTFWSVVILHRNVLAGVVGHERRRHKAYYCANGNVDGNRIARLKGGEQGCRDNGRRTAGNHGRELIA
jgi:hypothetical protein